ncbi:hypothetical protein GCM10017667_77780 [Streptomyces filamentosus]|uniref:Uncharacterized protein n=1 Tax=Streptomyces filamentosus TaxID=67294 RepID=A0A919BY68_STRFL|nr:hypothetical protein GCM10017667_77780 [Streptomyces filamentosus]
MLRPEVGEGRAAGVVGVLHPAHGLRDATGAEVHGRHRLGPRPRLAQETHELARPEPVGLRRPPRHVEPARPVLHRPDAVLPAVPGDDVAARVAHRRDAELPDQAEDVGAEAVRVGGGAARLVDAGADAAPQVLDEGTEEAGVDGADGELWIEGEAGGVLGG